MRETLLIGVGGFLGANARYLVGGWVAARLGAAFPYGTLMINVSGSLVLGFIMGGVQSQAVTPATRLAFAIGFLGAYTTFSTFTYETIRLLEDGSVLAAFGNAVSSVLAGLAASIAGLAMARTLWG